VFTYFNNLEAVYITTNIGHIYGDIFSDILEKQVTIYLDGTTSQWLSMSKSSSFNRGKDYRVQCTDGSVAMDGTVTSEQGTINVGGYECQYEIGTTWAQWASSEYNTTGAYITNERLFIFNDDYSGYLEYQDGTKVDWTDAIDPTQSYCWV
jgi:hypothetical protein